MESVVAFLTGDGADGRGRTFEDVVAMDDAALESNHDFIQWLFPLPEPSRAVPGSPVLTDASLAALAASSEARQRLQRAASRMAAFYDAHPAWLRRYDHNHLRITRIIRSLRLIVGDAAAGAFRSRILDLAGDAPIDPRARAFWAEA